jgi:hypothetical protein
MPVTDLAPEYSENQDDWKMIRDVLKGAKAIREGGVTYLPMLGGMSWGEYEAYKKRAQFFNATARTLNGLVGMIFRKEPEIILDGAEVLRPSLEACTIDNQPFTVFARAVVREILSMGRVGALVDAPVNGGSPYFSIYMAENITNWRNTRASNGKIVANQVILKEDLLVESQSGFGSDEITIYRELYLDEDGVYTQRLWFPVKTKENVAYAAQDAINASMVGAGFFRDEMPFICFGPMKSSLKVQRPPILDIAELNVLHFQRSAQLAHGQFYTATPTYWAIPPNTGDIPEYRVGPNTVWLVDQPNSCGILEYRGEGLRYLESACTQLENQMAGLGARLVADRRNTAGESNQVAEMRSKGESALLYEIVDSAERGLTDLLKIWVRWNGRNPQGVEVKLNRDFVDSALEYRTWLQLDRSHANGDIDDETYYRVLFEGEMLPASYGPADVKKLIDNAAANRADKAAETADLTPPPG